MESRSGGGAERAQAWSPGVGRALLYGEWQSVKTCFEDISYGAREAGVSARRASAALACWGACVTRVAVHVETTICLTEFDAVRAVSVEAYRYVSGSGVTSECTRLLSAISGPFVFPDSDFRLVVRCHRSPFGSPRVAF